MDEVTRDDLIGSWRAVRFGQDPSCLEPVDGWFSLEFTLREDGAASWEYGGSGEPPLRPEEGAPFPITWDIPDGRVLRIRLPCPPSPRQLRRGQTEWTRDDKEYRIVWVTDETLTVLGPFGGNMMVLERVGSLWAGWD